MLTKCMGKKLDDNYTRMLRAILIKSWRQHPTKQQLYGNRPPITKTIKVWLTGHAGHCWRSKDKLINDVLLWTPSHGREKAGQPRYSNSVPIRDVTLRTCRKQWTIEKGGERGSGMSVLISWHDDDDENYLIVFTQIRSVSFKNNCYLQTIYLNIINRYHHQEVTCY